MQASPFLSERVHGLDQPRYCCGVNDDDRGDAKPFSRAHLIPPELDGIISTVAWDLGRLHALELPVEELAVAELRWQLDLPWWRVGDRWFAVTPNQVRRDPVSYPEQWRRTLAADLRYPIQLIERRRLVVMDGVHRLLKADLLGLERIRACRVTPSAFDAVVVRRTACGRDGE
jgi:hypothetical protein